MLRKISIKAIALSGLIIFFSSCGDGTSKESVTDSVSTSNDSVSTSKDVAPMNATTGDTTMSKNLNNDNDTGKDIINPRPPKTDGTN